MTYIFDPGFLFSVQRPKLRNNSIFTKQNGIQLGDLFQRLAFTPRGVGACGVAEGDPERRKKTRNLARAECHHAASKRGEED
jgi:hypothetical protein